MPSKTPKQARFMRMCSSAKGRKKAGTSCPPKSVAKKYARSDRRKKK